MSRRWSVAASSSPGWVDLTLISLRSYLYRCRDLLPRGFIPWWAGGFSIVDEVMWRVITALESVALVSMLAFFFLFCGCTV